MPKKQKEPEIILELGGPKWNQQVANALLRWGREVRTGALGPHELLAYLTAMSNALSERLQAVAIEGEDKTHTFVFTGAAKDDPAYR